MQRWYQTFFNEAALDIWQLSRSEEMTADEVDYLEDMLELDRRGARVLDLACGNGRHAVGLAERGHSLTGVDIAEGNRKRVEARAAGRGVEVDFVIGDMSELALESVFDGGYCWGNSLGYFPRPQMQAFFDGASRALAPGAHFIVETATAAESILADLSRKTWMRIDEETRLLLESTYEPRESRLDTIYTTIAGDRVIDTSTAHVWIFTSRELVEMADTAGFETIDLHGALDGAAFDLGDERLILVLRRSRDE